MMIFVVMRLMSNGVGLSNAIPARITVSDDAWKKQLAVFNISQMLKKSSRYVFWKKKQTHISLSAVKGVMFGLYPCKTS